MVVWDLTRKLGITFTVLAVAVAVLATGIGLAMGGSGTWVGPMTGGILLISFGGVGVPLWLWSRSNINRYKRIAQSGPRITAVVDSVHQQLPTSEVSVESSRYWSVAAYGPDLAGGERLYNQMIGKTKPNLRRGDHITVAIDPTDPGKYTMLIPETAHYFSNSRPASSTTWTQGTPERRGPFYDN